MEKRENQNQNQEREKLSLEKFQQEIQKIKEAEEKGELKTGHFISGEREFNVKDLTEEDRQIYEEFKNSTLTREKFNEYWKTISSGQTTSVYYAAYIANKFTIELEKKGLAMKKLKNSRT